MPEAAVGELLVGDLISGFTADAAATAGLGAAGAGLGAGAAASDLAQFGTAEAPVGAAPAVAAPGLANAGAAASDLAQFGTAEAPVGTGAPWYLSSPSGGMVPGTDYSAYTGAPPTDVPQPLPDATIPPGASPDADQGILQRILAGAKKNPLTTASAAANLLAQIRAGKSAGSTSAQLKKLGQPVSDISQSLLSQYQSGKLNVGSQFDIDKWKNEQIARARNFYAKAGMAGSSAARNAEAQIEAQAAAMADKARTGLLTQGLNAAGIAQGPLATAIEQQAKDDTALSDAAARAMNALILAQTLQNKNPAIAGAASG